MKKVNVKHGTTPFLPFKGATKVTLCVTRHKVENSGRVLAATTRQSLVFFPFSLGQRMSCDCVCPCSLWGSHWTELTPIYLHIGVVTFTG